MSEERRPSQKSPNGVRKSSGNVNGPSSGSGPTPNPRSCVTCRRRKVKCDKKNPCSNCVRAKIDCIFPGPGRAPRKSRKPPDAELLERLRRLESVVTSLNAQVEEHEQDAADRERERQSNTEGFSCPIQTHVAWNAQNGATVATDDSVEGLENRFGRLVVEKGRSRYINNSFWANLNNEVEDLKTILIEPSDDEDDAHSPGSPSPPSHYQSFMFGYSSSNVDMQALHPPEQQARQFWEVYKENVESLVKILHVPTFEPTVFEALANTEKVSKGLETLLFTIYYGAVTSTTSEDCLARWGEERSVLLSKYRYGLEQALARANFLCCDEVIILQAFVVFLFLLRRNDDARKIWTLTGLVVRISQTLGIHRDGSHFGLPPFETEMRRRLWWQVCILDARSSEDHGCDPTIVESQFDTKMPLNVNDSDIHPNMTEFPEERKGFTDMTFCLLRFEIASIMRRIVYVPPGPNKCTEFFANRTIEQKEKWISDCHAAIEEKYLKNCDMTIPICWVTGTISRLIMSKMWLIIYHPHQRRDGGATLPQETKDKLFITSLENIEYGLLLETEARTMKWGWLFRTYVQWHAIAFLLSELCVRTKGEAVDRAWRALEASAGRWWFPLHEASSQRRYHQGCLWKPLGKLLAKAQAARQRENTLERACPGDPFALESRNSLQQIKMSALASNQQDFQSLDSMLRPSPPNLGDIPSTELPGWLNSPSQARSRTASVQDGHGLDMQRRLSDVALNGYSNADPWQRNPGKEFGSLLDYGLDKVITDVMADAPISFSDFGQGISSIDESTHSKPTHTSQPLSTSQAFATNNAPTVANGYPTFRDSMLPNSNINFGVNANGSGGMGAASESSNGQGTGEATLMENGEMDWTLWDDLVSQYGIDGTSTNPASTAGPGSLGLVHWF